MNLHDVRKLTMKRYREEFGHFLVEGEHGVLELQKAAARDPRLLASELYVTHEYERWQSPFATHVIGVAQMAKIADTKTPQGIVAVVPILAAAPPRPGERAIYLAEAQDPGNVGTVLRTLGWFGGFRLLLGPGSVDPWNPKVVRASSGAIFHVAVETEVAPASLAGRFARIAALDLQGRDIREAGFADFHCYVFGNEARGLPADLRDALPLQKWRIAGEAAIESLNLATSVSVCVYELQRQGVTSPSSR